MSRRCWRTAHQAQRKLFFNLRSQKKRLGWMTNQEIKTVANELGVDPADVREMEGRLAAHDAAFDAPADSDEESNSYAPAYYLENDSVDPAVAYEEQQWQENTHGQLYAALSNLDDRSKDILEKRWFADNKSTLHELADIYGVSAERIRQLEQNAIKKLKGAMLEA